MVECGVQYVEVEVGQKVVRVGETNQLTISDYHPITT